MGFYSSEIPDFTQAVESVLVEHGLIQPPAEPAATEPAPDGQQADQGQHADQSQPAG